MNPQLSIEDFAARMDSGVYGRHDVHYATVETAHAQLCDAAQHVEVCQDNLLQAGDHLNAMVAMVDHLQPTTTLSQPALETLEAAVRHLVASMGGRRASVSMEAHATKPRTQVALESVAETIKRVWDRIITALRSAWAWFKNFLAALFDTSRHIQRRCQRLEKKLATLSDEQKQANLPDNKRLQLFVGHLGPNAEVLSHAVVKAYVDEGRAMSAISQGSQGFMKDASVGVQATLEEYNRLGGVAPDEQAAKFKTFVDRRVVPLFSNPKWYTTMGCKKISTTSAPEAKPNTDLYVREFALGNGRFYGRVIAKGTPAEAFASSLRHAGFGISRAGMDTPAKLLEALSRSDCRAVLKIVDQRMSALRALQAEAKTLDATLAAFMKDKDLFQIKAGHEHLKATMVNILTSVGLAMIQFSTQSTRSLTHYELDCAKRMLDYVGASANNLHDPLEAGLRQVAREMAARRT